MDRERERETETKKKARHSHKESTSDRESSRAVGRLGACVRSLGDKRSACHSTVQVVFGMYARITLQFQLSLASFGM